MSMRLRFTTPFIARHLKLFQSACQRQIPDLRFIDSHTNAHYLRSLPPLISIVAPVMNPATGLATKTMHRAISSGEAYL